MAEARLCSDRAHRLGRLHAIADPRIAGLAQGVLDRHTRSDSPRYERRFHGLGVRSQRSRAGKYHRRPVHTGRRPALSTKYALLR